MPFQTCKVACWKKYVEMQQTSQQATKDERF